MSVTRAVDRQQRQLSGWLVKVERILSAVQKCLKRCEEDNGDRTDAG